MSRPDRARIPPRLIAPKHMALRYRNGLRRASICWSIERQSDGGDVFVLELQKPAPQSIRNTPREPACKAGGDVRRIAISLSEEQFQKLSIAALKKGSSRNELLRESLKGYVARLLRDLQTP